MANLMKLNQDAMRLVDLIDNSDAGIDSPDVIAEMKALEAKGVSIVAQLASVKDEYEMRASARKARADELAAMVKHDKKCAETMKAAIEKVMAITRQDRIDLGGLVITMQKSAPSVQIIDESLIPPRYKIVTVKVTADQEQLIRDVLGDAVVSISEPEVSKSLIKKASDENIGIAGTEIVQNKHVRIKGVQ